MRWRAGLAWLLVLLVGLAACGGDDDKEDTPTPTPALDGTQEADPGIELSALQPGLQVRDGLTLITHSRGTREGIVYFYAELRNDSDQYVSQIESFVYPLDADGFQLGTVEVNSLLTDIPPGTTILIGRDFPAPQGFADAQYWVWYEPTEEPQIEGFFNLPTTVDFKGQVEGVPYLVRGTATNNTGQNLLFPVIDVALIGPDDNLVGYARAILRTAVMDGTWPAGETATYEAGFTFLAVETERITGARVTAAGYVVP